MADEIKVYTLAEVENILKCTRRTVYNYIQRGLLPAIKTGTRWRVRHEDLDAFVKAGSKEGQKK